MNHPHEEHQGPDGFWRSRYAAGLLLFGAVAGYFLVTEHLAHVVDALPYLLLAACPLMHLFMHHGRGGHGSGQPQEGPASPSHRSGQSRKGESS
jgi:hypothetical protein